MRRANATIRVIACGVVVALAVIVLTLGPRGASEARVRAAREVEALTGELGRVVSQSATNGELELRSLIQAWLSSRPEHLRAEVELDGAQAIVVGPDGDGRRDDPPLASAGMAIYRGGERWGTARLSMFEHDGRASSSAGQWGPSAETMAGAGVAILLGVLAIRYAAAARSSRWGIWSRARDRVSETLDFLAEGVVLFDASGRVIFANQAFGDVVGMVPHRLHGMPGGQLGLRVIPSDGEDAPPWEITHASSCIPASIRLQRDGGHGERRVFNVSCSAIRGRRGILGVLATFDDVTVLEQQREELRVAKDSATHASEAKSGFLANMSHEIRTPINGVMGTLELLQLTALTGHQRRYLEAARGSAGILLHLINDILDFSKIEAGKLELSSVIFSLEECVRQAVQVVSVAAAAKDIELVLSAAPVAGLQAWGDPDRLKQILINLASNAIKFSNTGQVVIFIDAEVEPDDRLRVDVDVQDSGIGMTPDQLRRLFRSFSQADVSTSRKYGGTGLGLAISKQLCGLMHGHIQVVSTEGVGSTFSFSVRLAAGGSTPPLTAVEKTERALQTIIAYEPNQLAGRVLIAALRAAGFAACHVRTIDHLFTEVRQSLSSAEQATVLMGAMAWTEQLTKVALALRTGIERDRLRIFGVTFSEPGAKLEAAVGHAVDVWVPKPFTAQSLAESLCGEVGRNSTGRAPQPQLRFDAAVVAGRRVLVAEDNAVGQLVTGDYLRTLGFSYHIVDRGDLVVQAAADEIFDLILMDCHLPVMDGFNATARIREHERRTGRKPVKIVALTAAAMEEDRQKCIRSGMDGYLSKPLELTTLARALAEHLQLPTRGAVPDGEDVQTASPLTDEPVAESREARAHQTPAPDETLINTASLMNRCMNKADLAVAMLQVFEQTIVDDLNQLQAAVAQGNAQAASEVAHGIVGSAAQVGADSVARRARGIETEAAIHQTEWLKLQADELAEECRRCIGYTAELRREGADHLRSCTVTRGERR
ncbi:MAG: ATP-binding protein [Phycisphaerales bacterium]